MCFFPYIFPPQWTTKRPTHGHLRTLYLDIVWNIFKHIREMIPVPKPSCAFKKDLWVTAFTNWKMPCQTKQSGPPFGCHIISENPRKNGSSEFHNHTQVPPLRGATMESKALPRVTPVLALRNNDTYILRKLRRCWSITNYIIKYDYSK